MKRSILFVGATLAVARPGCRKNRPLQIKCTPSRLLSRGGLGVPQSLPLEGKVAAQPPDKVSSPLSRKGSCFPTGKGSCREAAEGSRGFRLIPHLSLRTSPQTGDAPHCPAGYAEKEFLAFSAEI